MNSRHLVLALLLAPMLAFGAWLGLERLNSRALLPGLEPEAVQRVEISRAGERLVLARGKDGAWVVASAADAPGDAGRIEAALKRLAALRGKPATDAPPRRDPLLVVLDSGGERRSAAFWTGEGQALPAGERLLLAETPALPLWPSAWSDLAVPRIDPATVASVARLTPEGAEPLDADAAVQVAAILQDLSASGFVAGGDVRWSGAKLVRVRFADGSVMDLQQVPDGAGRYFLRLASDSRADVRAVRRFAFRVTKPLP